MPNDCVVFNAMDQSGFQFSQVSPTKSRSIIENPENSYINKKIYPIPINIYLTICGYHLRHHITEAKYIAGSTSDVVLFRKNVNIRFS
jgi:hypothetical protein